MKIVLTYAQAKAVIQACEWAINDNFPMSDAINMRYQRIINKLENELKKEAK